MESGVDKAENGGLAVLGGSFNPPHLGHLRLALELAENLDLTVELTPCGQPPHKAPGRILDFELRCALLRPLLGASPALGLNMLEGARPGPSYTYDTMIRHLRRGPAETLHFALGAGDFMTIAKWRQADKLLGMVNFIIVPRQGIEQAAVSRFIEDSLFDLLTPERPARPEIKACWRHKRSGLLFQYLPVTRIDISSSQVRQAWRRGLSLQGLVPESVEQGLLERKPLIDKIWK